MKNCYCFQNEHNTHIIIIVLLLVIIAMIYMYHNKKNNYEHFQVEMGMHCDEYNKCDDDSRCCKKNEIDKKCPCKCSSDTCVKPDDD